MENVFLENDVKVKSTILDDDDFFDAMAPILGSCYNSPDVRKQVVVAAMQKGKVDDEPGRKCYHKILQSQIWAHLLTHWK